ncbi:hypothetical protein BPAE_0044g00130 [Botrytis paeoniae]|uniref:Peptidase S8/S53 domain-containing protein n=1 Tax=Botrytis paeoniae TaxID=278948 RepID=A0A4Z1FVF3_9HELO|nr:hypothetical protein BPAE_0044g00130 [Botrytis paeoniae]
MFCLLQFYSQTKVVLAERNPLLKFVVIKLVVFLFYVQSFIFGRLTTEDGQLQPTDKLSYPPLSVGIPNTLLCVEMAGIADLHLWAYPWQEYGGNMTQTSESSSSDNMMHFSCRQTSFPIPWWQAFVHVLSFGDILKGIVEGFHRLRSSRRNATMAHYVDAGIEDRATPYNTKNLSEREAIEKALERFDVEILDWYKVDLCPEAMWMSSRKLKEVYLRWSGNNAVLRGWSEPEGLRRLENLKKIHLHIKQDLESRSRMQRNIKCFCDRLNSGTSSAEHPRALSLPLEQPALLPIQPRIIQVKRSDEDGQNERLLTMNFAASEMKQDQILQPYKWLDCMDKFKDVFQNVLSWKMKQKLQQQEVLMQPVEIVLIDGGVDVLQSRLRGKISDGKSFDYGDKGANRIRSHWISERGHGTVMAKNIVRICLMTKIYVIRLETHFDHKEQKARIGTRSAAEQPDSNSEEKEKLDSAVRRAVKAGILLFCSAADKGLHQDNDYPVASNPTKMFKIGAAKPNGNVWDWEPNIRHLDFIVPGQNFQLQTGSSVATALGAGLAALVICCVRLASIHTQMSRQKGHPDAPSSLTLDDLRHVKNHENMKAALRTIGTSPDSDNNFIEIWRLFDKATRDMAGKDKEQQLGVIVALAYKLRFYETA